MALVGNLQDFSVLQLLRLINQGQKTGRLTIEGGQKSAVMFFEHGKLTSGSMSGQVEAFREGLRKGGRVSEELDRYISEFYRPVTEKGLALLLEEAGILTRDEVVAQESARLQQLLSSIFSWESGTFEFEPDELPPLEVVTVSLGLEDAIVEGSRRIQAQEAIAEIVPDLSAVVRFTRQQEDKVRSVSLGAEEWRVIACIDGKNSVKMIADASGFDDFKARKLICGLVNAGLVELVSVDPPGEPLPDLEEQPGRMGDSTLKRGIVLRLIDRVKGI